MKRLALNEKHSKKKNIKNVHPYFRNDSLKIKRSRLILLIHFFNTFAVIKDFFCYIRKLLNLVDSTED